MVFDKKGLMEMTDSRYHNHELKSLVFKENGKFSWGIVFYDSTKNKTIEKELRRQLKKAQENES